MVLDDYFQIFLRHCKVKNLAPTTVNFYRMSLEPFVVFCEDKDRDFLNKTTVTD